MTIRQSIGQGATHVPQGGDQAIDLTGVFDAFSDGQNRRVGGDHMVVHMNAAPHGQSGRTR